MGRAVRCFSEISKRSRNEQILYMVSLSVFEKVLPLGWPKIGLQIRFRGLGKLVAAKKGSLWLAFCDFCI